MYLHKRVGRGEAIKSPREKSPVHLYTGICILLRYKGKAHEDVK